MNNNKLKKLSSIEEVASEIDKLAQNKTTEMSITTMLKVDICALILT